jgi:hypothetical protein
MDRFVATLNIEHFRQLLASETDEAKRQRLKMLLAEEEAKLAAARRIADEAEKRDKISY